MKIKCPYCKTNDKQYSKLELIYHLEDGSEATKLAELIFKIHEKIESERKKYCYSETREVLESILENEK